MPPAVKAHIAGLLSPEQEPDPKVRGNIVKALAEGPNPNAWRDELVLATADPDAGVRAAAAEGIGKTESKSPAGDASRVSAHENLVAAAKNEEEGRRVRVHAVKALATMGDRQTLLELCDHTQVADEKVRAKAVGELLRMKHENNVETARTRVKTFELAANDPSPAVKGMAAILITEADRNDPALNRMMVKALAASKDPEVRSALFSTIAKSPSTPDAEILVGTMLKNEPDPNVKASMARNLDASEFRPAFKSAVLGAAGIKPEVDPQAGAFLKTGVYKLDGKGGLERVDTAVLAARTKAKIAEPPVSADLQETRAAVAFGRAMETRSPMVKSMNLGPEDWVHAKREVDAKLEKRGETMESVDQEALLKMTKTAVGHAVLARMARESMKPQREPRVTLKMAEVSAELEREAKLREPKIKSTAPGDQKITESQRLAFVESMDQAADGSGTPMKVTGSGTVKGDVQTAVAHAAAAAAVGNKAVDTAGAINATAGLKAVSDKLKERFGDQHKLTDKQWVKVAEKTLAAAEKKYGKDHDLSDEEAKDLVEGAIAEVQKEGKKKKSGLLAALFALVKGVWKLTNSMSNAQQALGKGDLSGAVSHVHGAGQHLGTALKTGDNPDKDTEDKKKATPKASAASAGEAAKGRDAGEASSDPVEPVADPKKDAKIYQKGEITATLKEEAKSSSGTAAKLAAKAGMAAAVGLAAAAARKGLRAVGAKDLAEKASVFKGEVTASRTEYSKGMKAAAANAVAAAGAWASFRARELKQQIATGAVDLAKWVGHFALNTVQGIGRTFGATLKRSLIATVNLAIKPFEFIPFAGAHVAAFRSEVKAANRELGKVQADGLRQAFGWMWDVTKGAAQGVGYSARAVATKANKMLVGDIAALTSLGSKQHADAAMKLYKVADNWHEDTKAKAVGGFKGIGDALKAMVRKRDAGGPLPA
jgi:hypothetical protein